MGRPARILRIWARLRRRGDTYANGVPRTLSERKTGLYVRNVETVRLVSDERGWLRLAGGSKGNLIPATTWQRSLGARGSPSVDATAEHSRTAYLSTKRVASDHPQTSPLSTCWRTAGSAR